MKRALLTVAATVLIVGLAAATAPAQPMWAPSGVPVCQSGCPGDLPLVVSDAAGGAYVAWSSSRNNLDVYLQRVSADGLIPPGWPPDGLGIVVDPATQDLSGLASDGLGGALVSWEDWRDLATTSRDPYVQRVRADGSLPPGWALNGNPATLAPSAQFLPQVAPDGTGGAFVVWEDNRDYAANDFDLYAQHLTPDGAVAPGWPAGGAPLVVLPGVQEDVIAMPDDAGGAVFVWSDDRPNGFGTYTQRVLADGSMAPGWTVNGITIALGRPLRGAARDEAGGFYVVSTTNTPDGLDAAYYLHRYTFDGVPAPGWPAGGVLVCSAPGDRAGASIDADGTGGALLSWYDYRPPYDVTGGRIFALRVLASGAPAAGWVVNGTLVSDPTAPAQAFTPHVARDGLGGGYVVWQLETCCYNPSVIQHLTGNGQAAAGWPTYGLQVSASFDQFDSVIASDGQGGAIVAWDERGAGGRFGIWAQRFGPGGATPVQLSLVNATAREGFVALDWYAAAGAGLQASVYRRTGSSDWLTLGTVSADGTGHLRYEDRAVSPGERYAYRLGYMEAGVEQFSADTWVEVPALALALEGFRPNPAVGAPRIAFTLPDVGPARLEVFDVVGREVFSRDLGSLPAGPQRLTLDGTTLSPGIYVTRLTRGGRTLSARGVVTR